MSLRLLSGLGGLLILVVGLLFSVGAILAAPLGIWLVNRWARRHDRRPSRVASLVGAVLASSVLAGILWGIIFTLIPRPTPEQLQSAVEQGQSRPAVKLPDWYAKSFPQSARADSASQQLVQSPGFTRAVLVFTAIFMAVFFGVLGGALGWSASSLLRFAWYGRPAA